MKAILELESTAIALEIATNTFSLLHESFSEEVQSLRSCQSAELRIATSRLEMYDHAMLLLLSEVQRIQQETGRAFRELHEAEKGT